MGLAQVLPEGGVWVGKDRVVNGLLKLFPEVYDVTQCSFEITSMFAEGNVVFMEFDVNAMSADGRPYYGVKYVSIVEVAGEKIRWIREYPDTGLAKATLPGLG
jgi:ketosteroid isomerase-like protein